MRTLKVFLLSGLIGALATLTAYILTTEATVARWHSRVESVEAIREINQQITVSYLYSEEVVEIAQKLATLNAELVERERLTMSYVASLEDENTRLKASLVEATKHLNEQVEENNALHKQLENTNWRIKTLEETVQSLNEALRKVNEAQRDQVENDRSEQ